ncbi:MerR family transcriptional regulator [Streptomyces radicis]|uniref:MerR family transcriptional regulator n=1 Tax=Streptomyces radicis TaxID=1750517 RepID=A0A3A9W0X3_9ACTN|nr:MerR family transcriptional regulator [Streptomyces radicis]RKN06620.1 MerR family transcriptional regulator [Streptomyces radicis]RKN19245.1 MerR family transcriptional regulator [Streptomyces radicis]
MRLAELSRRSGVSPATIKYYLREGLLPAGARVSATQAEYDEEHLRRLRLVRALVQVGRVPVATARRVLAAVDDESAGQFDRLGEVVTALPHGPAPDDDDHATARARETADEVQRRLGWRAVPGNPAHQALVAALAALVRLGYPASVEDVMPYGRVAADIAEHELAVIDEFEASTTQLEAAVALTVLYEPVLLNLRRLAQANEAGRVFRIDAEAGD